jgi:hypothetical protein
MVRALLIALLLALPAQAQLWSGIIDPLRATDWSGVGVTGGIPTTRTNCVTTQCNTVSSGATVTAASIQAALNSAPSNTIVRIPAGSFTLSSGIALVSNVTLRGAGANLTVLTFTGTSSFYWGNYLIGAIGNYDSASDNGSAPGYGGCAGTCKKFNFTGTNGQAGVYTKDATVINLSGTPTGLSAGMMLKIAQNDDAAAISATPSYFVCAAGSCSRDQDGSPQASQGTAQFQNVKVVSVNGTAVTISPGLYLDTWRTSQSPVAWYQACCDVRGAGVEDIRVVPPASTAMKRIVAFFEASDSWMKGIVIDSIFNSGGAGTRTGLQAVQTHNITIKDSVVGHMFGGGFGSFTSYGIEIQASSAYLIENNILFKIESPLIFTSGNAGGVAAYNYEIICDVNCSDETGILPHGAGYAMDLMEGNEMGQYWHDDSHGPTMFSTLFRNLSVGNGAQGPQDAININSWNRFLNIVGNILAPTVINSGHAYEVVAPNTCVTCGRFNGNIYRVGYPGPDTSSPSGGVPNDLHSAETILRWGNWDNVNNATRFVNAEVPSGLSTYANAVPATQVLPPSLYYNSKPTWWPAAKPWPLMGPDVTGGNISGTGGHAYTTAAHDCFTSISGTLANFNAGTCYPLTTASANLNMNGVISRRGNVVTK